MFGWLLDRIVSVLVLNSRRKGSVIPREEDVEELVSVNHFQIYGSMTRQQLDELECAILDSIAPFIEAAGADWFAWCHGGECEEDAHGAHWCKPPDGPTGQ